MQVNVYEQDYLNNLNSVQLWKWLKWPKWLGLKILTGIKGFIDSLLLPCPVEERLEEIRQKARNYAGYRGIM